MSNPLRSKVIQLYKTLLHLGKDHPQGRENFNRQLKAAFLKNRDVTDELQIKRLIARGNYVVKEIEALYKLKKYRTLKKRYYSDDPTKDPS